MTALAILLAVSLVAGTIAVRAALRRKLHTWLPSYTARALKPRPRVAAAPVDILFCFVDHYEPGWNHADYAEEVRRVEGWHTQYPVMASAFTDADGYHPRHSWFYPPHYYRPEHLDRLVQLCMDGFGEIEMHLHHNRMDPFPDSSQTLRQKILSCIETYSRFGIFETRVNGAPATRYGFIHGDWALDGSRPEFCGVADELSILRETGCFADFTFPAYLVESQPKTPNTIFYAIDDRLRPSSHRHGRPVRAGGSEQGDLLIVQGPLGFRWRARSGIPLPAVDDGEICAGNPPTRDRVDYWIRTAIHVEGRPEWIIVKVFTHGAALREHPVLLGDPVRRMHAHLRDAYNDGVRYRLHYVTARELYNVIKAAEAGHSGDAGRYRDFVIEPYAYRRGAGQPSRPRPSVPER